jgi:beta-N-acetylhexosaminidase
MRDASADRWVEKQLRRLSLEARVGQMITAEITGLYVPDDDERMARWLDLARTTGVGGFVLYGGSPREVVAVANRLQEAADIPLLISADFEGGPGQQVSGASEFPANMAFAAVGSEDLVYRAARAGAAEGRAMGIHLTYSPVADFTAGPENPAESVRSFGGDPALVGRMLRAYIRGYQENGMLACTKHFPGRGDSRKMPGHPGFSWLDKSREAMEAGELACFKHAIDAGASLVMTEHIAVPSVTDGSELPASVEPRLTTEWLRGKLGFQGIVSSDDLWYDAVVERFGAEEVAVKAVLAGHDILLKPRNPAAAAAAVVAAVRAGRITERRIDESVRKILAAKARLSLHRSRRTDESRVASVVGSRAHAAVVCETADRSLTVLRNEGLLPAAPQRLRGLLNVSIQKAETDPSPAQLAARLAERFPGTQSVTLRPESAQGPRDRAIALAAKAELVILSLFVPRDRNGETAPLRAEDLAVIETIAADRPVIAMSYGNPYLITRLPRVGAFVVGWGEKGWFGNQAVYFDSFIRLLTGEIRGEGRLPVRVSDLYPIGAGLPVPGA